MDTDPLSWNVSQVTDFFRHQAARFLSDRPSLRLPDLESFLQTLEENDINGDVLLNAVDSSSLRDDLGVRSFGARTAVMHCIRKLQEVSKARPTGVPEPVPQTPNSIVGLSHPSHSDPELVAASTTPGENVRAGETEVQDGRGKKRRKLDLSAMQTVGQAQPAKTRTRKSTGYMSDAKLPVDDLFYGKTAMNSVIGDLSPEGDGVVTKPDYPLQTEQGDPFDDDTARWHTEAFVTFQEQDKDDGDASYVFRQLRHYLANDEIKPIRRRGKDAIAVLPYREELISGKKSVSATVFRLDESAEDGAIAVREPRVNLDSENDFVGVDVLGQEQESNSGEWDFLATKWARREGDDPPLPEFGQSEDDGEMSSRFEREFEDEQAEVQEELKGNLEEDAAGEIVDNEILAMAGKWRETKLPRKEEKQAWTVWKKMKGSKSVQTHLIESANERIKDLDKRLAKQKEYILQTEWRKEKDVREQCDAMTTTVEEREELKWKISVWNRRQEPHHVVRHGQHHGGPKGKPDGGVKQRIVVRPDDRLSLSPAPAAQEDGTDADGDLFHTPEGGFEQDEEGQEQQIIDDGHSFDGGDEMEEVLSPMADWIEPSPPEIMDSPSFPFDSSQGDRAMPNESTQRPANNMPIAGTDSEGEELPDLATLLSQRPRPTPVPKSTPKKVSSSNNRDQPIEISSDSHSTPESKSRRKKQPTVKQPRTWSANPDDATAAEVEAWDMDELKERQDRRRILIKLLAEAGADMRKAIDDYIRELRMPGFVAALRNTVGELSKDFDVTASDETHETAIFLAKLYLAYVFLSPQTMQGEMPNNVSKEPWIQQTQLQIFAGLLRSTLTKQKLFVAPKPEPTSSVKSKPSPGAVISLLDDEDDDSDPSRNTPSKRKQKKPLLSMKGAESQRQAFSRQDRFKELQKQSSSQNELEAMVHDDPSRSHIKVNILKEDDKENIFVDKHIAQDMKDHQIRGVQFMWRELTADAADEAQGCILAHEQGLGKTVQAIAVLVALNEAAQSKNPRVYEQLPPRLRPQDRKRRQLRTLVLVPASLIANWRAEFQKWAPEKLPNVWSVESHNSKDHERSLMEWQRLGGVLLIGYELFQKRTVQKVGNAVKLVAEGLILECLLNPGPDVVVADEAHKLGNEKSLRSIAAKQILTESRLALTGTPMSNDVQEIYSLVSFVAPDFLGDSDWFNSQYARPIKDGNGKDSNSYQRRRAVKKLAVLHSNIEPKVDRANITVLQGSLPPKVEFVIKLPLTDVQHAAYSKYVQHLVGEGKTKDAAQVTLFGFLAVLTLLLNHPLTFKRKMLEPAKPRPAPARRQSRASTPSESDSGVATPVQAAAEEDEEDEAAESIRTSGFSEEVINHITSHIEDDIDPQLSTKMAMLVEIVRRSKQRGDKVLVFSQSIPTLNYLGELLRAFGFAYARIDGSVNTKVREVTLKEMNSARPDLMLMSTKAGGVGLNIQIANRVIILDSGFNPTHESQAISRSYRLGQKKPVFVYRFSVGGTFEDMLYNKQMFKERLNKGVVDKITTKRIANANHKDSIHEPKDVEQEDLEESLGKDEVLDGIVEHCRQEARQAGETKIMIRSLTTMEVLQEKVVDEPLNEEERREVELELQEGRNAAKGKGKGRKGAAATGPPYVGPSNFPGSTAPARSYSQSGRGASQFAPALGINGLPGSMAPPPAPMGSQLQRTQAPSRIVTLPTAAPPPSTAPTFPHGLPMPPPEK